MSRLAMEYSFCRGDGWSEATSGCYHADWADQYSLRTVRNSTVGFLYGWTITELQQGPRSL